MNEHIEPPSEYIQRMIDGGFITANGRPLKCQFCDCLKLVERSHYYESYSCVEYQVFCNNCEKLNGHWSYGNWEV